MYIRETFREAKDRSVYLTYIDCKSESEVICCIYKNSSQVLQTWFQHIHPWCMHAYPFIHTRVHRVATKKQRGISRGFQGVLSPNFRGISGVIHNS